MSGDKSIWAKIDSVFSKVGAFVTGTRVGDRHLLDVAVKESVVISANPSGLTIGGLISEITLSSASWTALPASALTDRNGLGIQNPTSTEIKLNFDSGEASFVGWSVAPSGETFIDITDSVTIYAKAASGTPTITIMEIA